MVNDLADLASNPANGTIIAAKKQDLFGWNRKAPTTLCASKADPVAYFTAYHGTYEAQFCTQVAKAFFDLHK